MSGVNSVSNLLNAHHTLLIVDLDVRLGSGNHEPTSIARVVNGVVLISLVEWDVLDRVAHPMCPTYNAAI